MLAGRRADIVLVSGSIQTRIRVERLIRLCQELLVGETFMRSPDILSK
jgi:indole-3-glycerol phosphate synthase